MDELTIILISGLIFPIYAALAGIYRKIGQFEIYCKMTNEHEKTIRKYIYGKPDDRISQ